MLKKPPVLLVGGFEAWKAKFPREVTLSTGAAVDPIPGMETLGSSASSSHPVIQPSAYGPQGFVANGHVEGHDPSQELWSASTTGSRSHVMDQIPEDERFVKSVFVAACGDPIRFNVLFGDHFLCSSFDLFCFDSHHELRRHLLNFID